MGRKYLFFSVILLLAACSSKLPDRLVSGEYVATTPVIAGTSLIYTLELKTDGTASFRRQRSASELSAAEFGFWEAHSGELFLTIMEIDSQSVTGGRKKSAATLSYRIEKNGQVLRSVDGNGPDFQKK